MSTNLGYQRYDPQRACDICGVVWHKSDLTKIAPLRWACPDDKDGLTAEQISRHNANARPLRIKPVKHAKGPSQTPTYQQAEATILNLILDKAPSSVFAVESGTPGAAIDGMTGLDKARGAGWAALYLGNLALENRRPRTWIEQAKAKCLSLCDLILTNQSAVATDLAGYGGVYIPRTFGALPIDVTGNAACLLALLRAYQLSSVTKYIVGARAIALFLRHAQCAGLYAAAYARAATADGGGRLLPAPFPEFVYELNGVAYAGFGLDYAFRPSGIICAWALAALKALDGDATYGATTASGDFVQRVDATLSASIAACVAWWEAGAGDGPTPHVVGFGPTTPREYYSAAMNGVGSFTGWIAAAGDADIDASLSVTGFEYAAGVRALYEVGGYTAKVAEVYTWLRGFSSDTANQIPATWSRDRRERSTLGTYDPTLCLARHLRVTNAAGSAIATEASPVDPSQLQSYLAPAYDWRTVGLLSPIQSARASGELRAAKDAMSQVRRRRWTLRATGGLPSSTTLSSAAYDRCDIQDDMRLLTFSGLSFQTSVGARRGGWTGSAFVHYIDLVGAAITADAYRYPPGAFALEQG